MRIKSFYDFIEEAIGFSDAKKATDIFLKSGGKQRYDDIFKGKDRIYYDFRSDSAPIKKSETEMKIEKVLADNGYYLSDYQKGLATKEGDKKNTFKVQKLLVRFGANDLKNLMDSDPSRFSSTKYEKKVVISRHGIDIAGQSTGRDWTSCKTLVSGQGINSRYVWSEISEGSLVAYLIESDDLNINKPIARIIIGVYIKKNDPSDFILFPDASVYGNYKQPDFMSFVEKWCDGVNKKISKNYEGIYNLSSKCYADDKRPVRLSKSDKINFDELLDIVDPSKNNQYRGDSIGGKGSFDSEQILNLGDFIKNNKDRFFKNKELLEKFLQKIKDLVGEAGYLKFINNNRISKIEEFIDYDFKQFRIYMENISDYRDIDSNKASLIKNKLLDVMFGPDNREQQKNNVLNLLKNAPNVSNKSRNLLMWIFN